MKNKEKKFLLSIICTGIIICLVTLGYSSLRKDQIKIIVKNKEMFVNSYSKTVKDLLDENKITYDEDDIISPKLETKLEDNMEVNITYVQKYLVSEHERMKYNTKIVKDKKLLEGVSVIDQSGKTGRKTVVYEEVYHNDKLISRNVEKETVRENPIDKVVKKGTGLAYYSNNATNNSIKGGRKMNVSATAYSGDTVTATGTTPKWGTIAVDPRIIPYGTRVYIPKFNMTFVAEDCGGGIKGNKIDIFMNSSSQCYNWGVKNIEIYILS